jgi:hypothetical protein
LALASLLTGTAAALGDGFSPVVKSGAAVPGQSATFANVNLAGVDASSGTAFIGTFTLNSQTYSGLYRVQNGVITTLADRVTLGPAGETINSIIANGDYENGVIVFAANTSAGRAVYRYTPGQGLSALVRQGDVLPGSPAGVGTLYNRGVGGDASEFAFGSALTDGSTAVFTSVSGSPIRTVDDKTRSPIAETGYFIDFPEISYRDGKTAFVGRGADPDWPGPGLPPIEPTGVFVATPGNPFDIVAGRNQEIPGGSGLRFREFERPRVMPDGRVGFAGGFIDEDDPANGPRHMGVFIRNPDLTWKKYIDSEMNLTGLHSDTEEFNQYSVETGWNFFGVNDVTGGSYLYYESSEGVFTHIIDTYSPLDGKALSRIRMLADTAIGSELFFRADFTDGSSGIYSVVVPEPATLLVTPALLVGVATTFARRRNRSGSIGRTQ